MKWEPCVIKIIMFTDTDVLTTSDYVDDFDNNGDDPFVY